MTQVILIEQEHTTKYGYLIYMKQTGNNIKRGKVLMYLEGLETKMSDFKIWLQDKVDDGAENYDKDEAFKECVTITK